MVSREYDVIALDFRGSGDSRALPAGVEPWLPRLSHVPISDDPALVGRLIRQFVDDAAAAVANPASS